MGMSRKAADIIGAVLGSYFIEQQERVYFCRYIAARNPANFHPVTVG
jgi:hypothetical protein